MFIKWKLLDDISRLWRSSFLVAVCMKEAERTAALDPSRRALIRTGILSEVKCFRCKTIV